MTDDRSLVPANGQAAMTFGSNIGGENLILPRVKIIQAMSGEKGEHGEEGSFFNVLTSEDYGPELRFLPIHPFMNRVLLVRSERRQKVEDALGAPLSEGDGLKCRSIDMVHGNGEPGIECDLCPLSKWDGNVPPLCSEVYNVAALTELGNLIILQFQRSSAKTGKQLNSMLRFAGAGLAPWSRVYVATTHEEKLKGKGTFYVPTVKVTPEIPAPELMRQAAYWGQQLGAARTLDVTPLDDDEPVNPDDGVVDAEAPF